MFRGNNFDKLLDKATSNLRLDPDWPTILEICDLIRQNDCTPKYAVAGVKKKLYSTNPHQAMFALLTLESIVKNCGSGVHDEVTSKAFCEMLRDLVKTTQHENLRTKILELIQAWAFAFRNSPKYRAVQDTVNILKAEGYKFPSLKESDAMFSADTAPEWAQGEVCHRCRVAFSLIVRRHHCRACGQVFCQQCSSKTSTLPKFGIEKEVRVCDACFDKVSRPPTSSAKLDIVDTTSDYGPSQKRPTTAPGGKTAEELQEEEELQLALALSQSEAEHKEKERKSRPLIAPDPTPHLTVSPTPSSVSASPEHSTQGNSELSRYLDRNYWESRIARDASAAPTAPAPASQASNDTAELQDFAKPINKAHDDDAQDKETDEFVETLKSQVEIFVNRMKSNSSRGRSIANDSAVQTQFMSITAMHSHLLKYIQQLDDKRVYLESLQDKVTQIRDSRAALDTLRAEHAARAMQAAEAAERQRQMQMAAKLQAMRKKKHEYLQYQRQLALQRVQEQEREMQIRQEQQKHQYMMSANSYYMPGVQQYQQYNPNQPIYANPQFHQMMPQTTDAGMSQPPMTQANLPTMAQSMPQANFAISQSTAALSQPTTTQTMTQNIRPNQMQLNPMMMQQMHQMRNQPGMHQMLPNGPGPSIPQQNGLPKQNLPPNSMMPTMSMPQQMMNNNQMMGMHMRMPMMQGNNPQIQGYISLPNNTQAPSMQQSQMMPGQMLQGPMMGQPGQGIPGSIPSQLTNQVSQQPQSLSQQPQQLSQQQQIMSQQPQQISQQPQQMSQQPQQMSQQPQQMSQQPQQMSQQPQQMSQQPQQMSQPLQQMSQQPQQLSQQPQSMPQQPQSMPQQQQAMPQQPQLISQQPQSMSQLPQSIPMTQQPPQQMTQQPQMSLQQSQMPPQSMPQNQMRPGQMPGQPMSGQPMQPPGHMIMQQSQGNIQMPGPQGQMISQPMQPPINTGQPQLPQQIQGGSLPPQMQGQMQQIQGQQVHGQPMKMPNNLNQTPQQPMVNQQTQQPQTPVKPEHNNNTAELIRFD